MVDLLVLGDHVVAPGVVALHQPAEGIPQVPLGKARHGQQIAPELVEGRGEGGERVGAGGFLVHGEGRDQPKRPVMYSSVCFLAGLVKIVRVSPISIRLPR